MALNQLCSASPCSQINDGEPNALEHVCGLTLPLAYDHGSVTESLFERAQAVVGMSAFADTDL